MAKKYEIDKIFFLVFLIGLNLIEPIKGANQGNQMSNLFRMSTQDIITAIDSLLPPSPNATSLQSDWFHLIGPSSTIRLFQLITNSIDYAQKNQSQDNIAFSPFAFKLTMIAMQAIGYNRSQEDQINQFLYNRILEKSLLETDLSDQQLVIDDTTLASNVIMEEILPSKKKREEIENSYFSFVTSFYYNYMKPAFRWLYGKTRVSISAEHRILDIGPYFYNLCYRFEPVNDDCFHLLRLSVDHEPRTNRSLTANERLRLCLSFQITDYHECIHQFTIEPENYFRIQYIDYGLDDIVRHLIAKFHYKSNDTSCYFHRILLLNSAASPITLIEPILQRYSMQHVDLEKEFSSSNVEIPVTQNELLNIIQFDQPLRYDYTSIGMLDFVGSKTKVEMLRSRDLHKLIQDDQFMIISIPFVNEQFKLLILLPKSDSNPKTIVNKMTDRKLYNQMIKLQIMKANSIVTLPRFQISGLFDFGPILREHNISNFNLEPNQTISSSIKQFIRVHSFLEDSFESSTKEESSSITGRRTTQISELDYQFTVVDRPFAYMLVGSYIDLHKQPAFEVLLAGILPNQMDSKLEHLLATILKEQQQTSTKLSELISCNKDNASDNMNYRLKYGNDTFAYLDLLYKIAAEGIVFPGQGNFFDLCINSICKMLFQSLKKHLEKHGSTLTKEDKIEINQAQIIENVAKIQDNDVLLETHGFNENLVPGYTFKDFEHEPRMSIVSDKSNLSTETPKSITPEVDDLLDENTLNGSFSLMQETVIKKSRRRQSSLYIGTPPKNSMNIFNQPCSTPFAVLEDNSDEPCDNNSSHSLECNETVIHISPENFDSSIIKSRSSSIQSKENISKGIDIIDLSDTIIENSDTINEISETMPSSLSSISNINMINNQTRSISIKGISGRESIRNNDLSNLIGAETTNKRQTRNRRTKQLNSTALDTSELSITRQSLRPRNPNLSYRI